LIKILATAIAALAIPSAFGQSETSEPKFEVASIRQSLAAGWQYSVKPSPGAFRATNSPLRYVITWAFNIQEYQLLGGPSWILDRYDINAKRAITEYAVPTGAPQGITTGLAWNQELRPPPCEWTPPPPPQIFSGVPGPATDSISSRQCGSAAAWAVVT
jgi:hypothetical protein